MRWRNWSHPLWLLEMEYVRCQTIDMSHSNEPDHPDSEGDPGENYGSTSGSARDPVTEHLIQFVDRESLRANLQLTPQERIQAMLKELRQRNLMTKEETPDDPVPGKYQSHRLGRAVEIQEDAVEESLSDLSDPMAPDPVLDQLRSEIDRSLLRENLKLTPEQRIQKLGSFAAMVSGLQKAVRKKY